MILMPGSTDKIQTHPQKPPAGHCLLNNKHKSPEGSEEGEPPQGCGAQWSATRRTEGLQGTIGWCVHQHLQPVASHPFYG